MVAQVFLHLLQNLVESLPARYLVVEYAGHALLHPRRRPAPRCAEDHVVDGGAQRVTRGAQRARVQIGCKRIDLEATHGGDDGASKLVHIRVAAEIGGDAQDGRKHRRGRRDQRVGPNFWNREQLVFTEGRLRGPTAIVTHAGRAWPYPCCFDSSRFCQGIVAHAYPRIAQHSISNPGISPVTWIAIAADRANAAKYGLLRSSSK